MSFTQEAPSETLAPPSDPLLDLALSRLGACPRAAQADLSVCLSHLRIVRAGNEDREQSIAIIDRAHARVISMGSKGLERHEDRALTFMTMAITEMRDNTPASNAQAERTLRQIRGSLS